jgi:phage minor structural protein, N-terminal region
MINVYSPTETNFKNNGLATLIPISCDFDIGINDKWQLTMEHPFDKELRYQHLVEDAILRVTGFSCVNEQEQDTNRFGLSGKVQLFRVFDTKKTLTSITVIAFPVALEAVYDTPIENLVIQNKTGIQAGEILDAQTQKYSVSSDITRTASSKYENTNLIGAISGNNDDSYVKKWGGEVVYDNNKIKIKNKIGDQSNASAYPIRYGRNLTGLTHEIDMSSAVTRMFPISSDDLRLNVWEDVTSQGGNRYVDSPDHIGDYPFIRCLFVQVDYSLLDTDSNSISETASATNGWREGIINAVTAQATALWTSIIQDLTNTYSPEYIQDLISGEDGIVGYLQKKYVYAHKGWQSFVKSCVKQGVEWIKSEELPTWEWHEDTSVIPHAWWYGDNSVSPAVSYAKNEYVKIGKNYEYFNNDGFWEDYKAMPHADCDWYEAQDGSGRKWFGYRKGYYAHNEYVYMTVEGQMKEWWYDEEGWYDESRSGDSDMGWHGDASSGFWFGEEDATSEDTNKFLHDRWAWIDGNYYWFDKYGYISGELDIPDYPWFVIETTQGSWFGNDQDEMLGAKWFSNQWAKIDGEWYYFDADGYVVDMSAKQSETIAWFANTVYNNTIAYITTCLTNAYTLLYRLMTEWCEKQYEDGIDLPTVNVSVDLIDLSKTTEYKDYSNLEKISLGDKVLVIGRDGSRYEERVVGLTFDCIRGYNTRVEVGQLSRTVSQIINVTYSGSSEGQKIIAGDGVTIDGKVISVGDYVGRTVGLQDVLLNGSTTVSGNVASFGIQAGENVSISRDGNILTINAVGGGGDGDVNLYHGIEAPSNSLGDDNDIYIQMEHQMTDLLYFDASYYGSAMQNYHYQRNGNKWDITTTFLNATLYHSFVIWTVMGLTVGKTYTVSFDYQNDGVPPLYSMGELFGLTIQHNMTCIDMRNYASELVEDGEFKYFENQATYGEFWYQSFPNDARRHHYEFQFTARNTYEYIGFYGDRTSGYLTCSLYELCIGDRTQISEIKDVYYKLDGLWLIDDNNLYLPFIGATTSTDGEDGLVPAPLIADKDKFLKGDGTWSTPPDTTYDVFEAPETSQDTGVNGLVPAPTYAEVQANKVLQADGTWVEQTGGTEVEANPSGTATETLQTVGIGGTIYEIQGGGGGGTSIILNGQIYSTEEKVVGVWKNNKPLYQKTCVFGSVSGQTANLSLGIANIEEAFLCADASYVNDGDCPLPYVTGTSYANNIGGFFDIGVNDTSFAIRIGQSMAGSVSNVVLTVRYTKTTDTAGSGGYQAYGFSPIIYSTEEREVGVWTDNKPLYEKTVYYNNAIPYRTWTTLVDDSSITIVDHEGTVYLNGSPYSDMDYHRGADPNEWVCSCKTDNGTKLQINQSFSGLTVTCRATYRYTKLADTAGSGSYTTLGVPAVHYTTDEQVIGTWIDGKPIYQKTFVFENAITLSNPNTWYSTPIVRANYNMDKIIDAIAYSPTLEDVYKGVTAEINDGQYLQVLNYRYALIQTLTVQYTKTTD